jgi:hypothetical protein
LRVRTCCRRFVDARTAFFVLGSLVKNLPNQTTEPMRDRTVGLCVSEARDETALYDGEDCALGIHRGVRGLIQDTPHPPISLRAAVAVVHRRPMIGWCAMPSASPHARGMVLVGSPGRALEIRYSMLDGDFAGSSGEGRYSPADPDCRASTTGAVAPVAIECRARVPPGYSGCVCPGARCSFKDLDISNERLIGFGKTA